MKGESYTQKAYREVYFSNSDVSFEFFYKNLADVLKEMISEKNIFTINKKLFSFISNFSYAIDTDDNKQEVHTKWLNLTNDLESDLELKKLIKYDQYNIDISVPYLIKYYKYFIRQIKLMSLFLSSLDRTYMPTTDASKSLFKWKNYHHFYNSYMGFKQEITNNLSKYSLDNFNISLNSIIVFYYGYNQYVRFETRNNLELVISNMIKFVSDEDFIKLITKEYKNSKDIDLLNNLKKRINYILLLMFDRINEEHSVYNIIPKRQEKKFVDTTGI